MRRFLVLVMTAAISSMAWAYDWDSYAVPADAGDGMEWTLQDNMSDDFNYEFVASSSETYINDKWKNFWHNPWEGPGPTQWVHENVYVADSHLNIKASRNGSTKHFEYHTGTGTADTTMPATQMGCMVSKEEVVYPVFIEARVKIADAVFANNVWMISNDDTEEIDICENYGGLGDAGRTGSADNSWFAKHIHLSHHVFKRDHTGILWDADNNRWGDYQPTGSEAGDGEGEGVDGTWYWENGRNDWAGEYSTIGVYWKSSNHLEYYINGEWVRTLSGNSYSYKNHTGIIISETTDFNVVDKYDYAGADDLNKPMKLIINIEAQDWNAVAGRYPTDAEITDRPDDHIMKVDWIRVYKPTESTLISSSSGSSSGGSIGTENSNDGISSSSEISEAATLIVRPNPCEDYLEIEASTGIVSAQLFRVDGSMIQMGTVGYTNYRIDTNELNTGVYILKVLLDNGDWSTHKVLKQ